MSHRSYRAYIIDPSLSETADDLGTKLNEALSRLSEKDRILESSHRLTWNDRDILVLIYSEKIQ
jgi:hypothetical protein